MPIKIDYHYKFASFVNQTYFSKLEQNTQTFMRDIAFEYRCSFQEFRQTVEAARDLIMWQEDDLQSWWQREILTTANTVQPSKKHFFQTLNAHLHKLKRSPKTYPANGFSKPKNRDNLNVISVTSDKKIFGMCPVASEETVCCNLKTIDAVENSAF